MDSKEAVCKDLHSSSGVDASLIHQEQLQVLCVEEMYMWSPKSACVTDQQIAYQVFDQMSTQKERLKSKKKRRCLKAWMFKYKPEKRRIRKLHNFGWLHTWSKRLSWRKNKSEKLHIFSDMKLLGKIKEYDSLRREITAIKKIQIWGQQMNACPIRAGPMFHWKLFFGSKLVNSCYCVPLEVSLQERATCELIWSLVQGDILRVQHKMFQTYDHSRGDLPHELQTVAGIGFPPVKFLAEATPFHHWIPTWINRPNSPLNFDIDGSWSGFVIVRLNVSSLQKGREVQWQEEKSIVAGVTSMRRNCYKSLNFKYKHTTMGIDLKQLTFFLKLWVLEQKELQLTFAGYECLLACVSVTFRYTMFCGGSDIEWSFMVVFAFSALLERKRRRFLTTWLLKFDKKPCVQGEVITYEGKIVGF